MCERETVLYRHWWRLLFSIVWLYDALCHVDVHAKRRLYITNPSIFNTIHSYLYLILHNLRSVLANMKKLCNQFTIIGSLHKANGNANNDYDADLFRNDDARLDEIKKKNVGKKKRICAMQYFSHFARFSQL